MTALFDEKLQQLLREQPEVLAALKQAAIQRELRTLLVKLRKSLGMSQADIAAASNWQQPHVARLERNAESCPQNLTIGALSQYADACGLSFVCAFLPKDESRLVAAYSLKQVVDVQHQGAMPLLETKAYKVG